MEISSSLYLRMVASFTRVETMFSFDPSTMNLLFTAAVIILFGGFVVLLVKLKPTTQADESLESDTGAKTITSLHVPSSELGSAQSAKAETSPAVEKPLAIIGATIGGSSIQTEHENTVKTPDPSREALKPEKPASITPVKADSNSGKKYCLHHFGYLRTFPKNSPIPDECFGCERIVDCLVAKNSAKDKK